jgi:predicted nucleic acid-binding protein
MYAPFGGWILPFTENTAPVCTALHIPDPRSERGAMIAATAIEHGFTVVTHNVQDFAHIRVGVFNPWGG